MVENENDDKWTTVRVMKAQLNKLGSLVKTDAAREMGINSVATAVKIAIKNLIDEIKDEIDVKKGGSYVWDPITTGKDEIMK
jgi:hypothetical protein